MWGGVGRGGEQAGRSLLLAERWGCDGLRAAAHVVAVVGLAVVVLAGEAVDHAGRLLSVGALG